MGILMRGFLSTLALDNCRNMFRRFLLISFRALTCFLDNFPSWWGNGFSCMEIIVPRDDTSGGAQIGWRDVSYHHYPWSAKSSISLPTACLQDGASSLHQQGSGRLAAGNKLNYIQHRYLIWSASLLQSHNFKRLTPRAPIDRAEMPDFIYKLIVVQVKLTLRLAFRVTCS